MCIYCIYSIIYMCIVFIVLYTCVLYLAIVVTVLVSDSLNAPI